MLRALSLPLLVPGLLALVVGTDAFTPSLGGGAPWERLELEGRVVQEDGGPIAAALVTFTPDEGGSRATRSDPEGHFRIRRGGTERAGILRVERMGYATAERRVAPGEDWVQVVLATEPLPLPGFQVVAEGPVCPSRDDEEARAIWSAMAFRHPGGLDTLGVASYTLAVQDTLSASGSHGLPEDGVGLVPGQRGSAPLLRISWTRRVEREGYAFPVRRTDASGSFDSWSYAPLEADFSSHFASPEFGRMTRFQVAVRGEEGTILRFCSRDEGRPGLEGRLELSPDTLLVRAEWRFRTSEPEEGAGGWARFPASLRGVVPPLLPLESMTWRKLREGGVQRRAQWYEEWILAPGDSVPFLPNRDWDGTPPWTRDR